KRARLSRLQVGRCLLAGSDIGGGRLLYNRHGNGRLRRKENFRGLLFVPHQRSGEIREFTTPAGRCEVPLCRDRSQHERLVDSIHLCGSWWHGYGEQVARAGGVEFLAIVAKQISDTHAVVWRAERRVPDDSATSRYDLAA